MSKGDFCTQKSVLNLHIVDYLRKWSKINFREKVYFLDPSYFAFFWREGGLFLYNIFLE